MQLWPVEHSWLTFLRDKCWSGKKGESKVFNWSELHLSEVTSYKIHISIHRFKMLQSLMFFRIRNDTPLKRALKWSQVFLQHFDLVNPWFRFFDVTNRPFVLMPFLANKIKIGENFVDSYLEKSWKHIVSLIIDHFCLKYFFIVNWTYCWVNSWKDGPIWWFAFLQPCGCYETFRGYSYSSNIRWNFPSMFNKCQYWNTF